MREELINELIVIGIGEWRERALWGAGGKEGGNHGARRAAGCARGGRAGVKMQLR